MNGIISKYISKLYLKQWSIGLCRGDIKNIIRNKNFDQNIFWLPLNSLDHFQADPFLLKAIDGNVNILLEDFPFDDYYGKISLMKLDNNFNLIDHKILLDTRSHLSYPFVYLENNITYIFPEAAHSGKLSCYQYNPVNESLTFLKDILDLPLLDSTIIKLDEKYWLFGTLYGEDPHNKLYIFYSENLLGPYIPHPQNPVKNSLNGTRPAGDFIKVDGSIFRPSQNCENQYGESITINKVNILDEFKFEEEPYMLISIDRSKHSNRRINTIHTINVIGDIIAVDGSKWTFSPFIQWKVFLKNRKIIRQKKFAQREK
jgi:small nuclear ribonucleoprotein (snRNP)-like protein